MLIQDTKNHDIDWSTVPILNEIANYLDKSGTIELSLTCKYCRLKLSSKVFYQISLFNQVYWKYNELNNTKLRGNRLKLAICSKMIEDMSNKAKLIKKVVINSRISSKVANLFFSKFNYCKSIIIDCKYDIKLSAVYNILKHLNYLEVFFMEAVRERDSKNTMQPPNFKFPKTLKSIIIFPYILERNFIPAINEINFSSYANLVDWNITGRYDIEKFSQQQQTNITHLYLRDIPIIDPDDFAQILSKNPQLKTLIYELEVWSLEKLNNILLLPNMKKIYIINYSFSSFTLHNFTLLPNKLVNTLIIECGTPAVVIEELLNKLEALEHIYFITWNLEEVSNVNWAKYRGRFKSITLGFAYWCIDDLGGELECLEDETIVTFDNSLKKVFNYDLTI
jgi:nitrogen regulatory protein PII-like uncharacterized protein